MQMNGSEGAAERAAVITAARLLFLNFIKISFILNSLKFVLQTFVFHCEKV